MHKPCQNSAAVEIRLRRLPNTSHRCHSLRQVARLEGGKYEENAIEETKEARVYIKKENERKRENSAFLHYLIPLTTI